MTNSIVTVNVSQTIAPTPSVLQKTGALLSQGGTNTTPGTYSLLTQLADLSPLLNGSISLTSAVWSATSGGQVTASTATNHGILVGDEFTIAGMTPAVYNGTYIALTGTVGNVLIFALAPNPGAVSQLGTFTQADVGELVAMATTFFAQGSQQGVYVLELGTGTPTQGVAFLTTWIANNPSTFYSYLVPREWDANAAFLSLVASFENTTAKTYFFVTTTLATYQNYTDLMKCVFALIEAPATGVWLGNTLTVLTWANGMINGTTASTHGVAVGQWFQLVGVTPAGYNGWYQALPGTAGVTLVAALAVNPGVETVLGSLLQSQYANNGIPSAEFTLASAFWVTLNYDPSTTNKVTPTAFSFLFGVTPFPTKGFAPVLAALKLAAINIVGTGAEGGISDAILLWGTTMDTRDFTYWYSVDWVQINVDLNVSNAVINGSNDPINPLYYNQDGINRLQQVAANTMASGVTFGLVLGTVVQTALDGPALDQNIDAGVYAGKTVVNAVPFLVYSKENPSDYKIGQYQGFAIVYVPARGFIHIVFNVNVTDFVTQ